jgi:hypothetical protein
VDGLIACLCGHFLALWERRHSHRGFGGRCQLTFDEDFDEEKCLEPKLALGAGLLGECNEGAGLRVSGLKISAIINLVRV